MQLFDTLPRHIEDALRASIERFGVLGAAPHSCGVVRRKEGRMTGCRHRLGLWTCTSCVVRDRVLTNLDLAMSSLPAPDRQRPRPEPARGSPDAPVRVLDLSEADVATPSSSP